MSENTELPHVDVPDDLSSLNHEAAEYRTLLELWQEVLSNAPAQAKDKVDPGWAVKISSQYEQLKLQEMELYRDAFYSKVVQLWEILKQEIDTDPRAFTHENAEDDAMLNRYHYLNVLFTWQLAVQQWEIDWMCTDDDAHIQIAAMSEVFKMFFGPTGLTQWLDNIPFTFTSDDQEELMKLLAEAREEAS